MQESPPSGEDRDHETAQEPGPDGHGRERDGDPDQLKQHGSKPLRKQKRNK
jgi:hypothetical protein